MLAWTSAEAVARVCCQVWASSSKAASRWWYELQLLQQHAEAASRNLRGLGGMFRSVGVGEARDKMHETLAAERACEKFCTTMIKKRHCGPANNEGSPEEGVSFCSFHFF